MIIDTIAEKMRQEFRLKGIPSIEERKKKLRLLRDSILNFQMEIELALKDDLSKSSFESYASEIGFILEDIRFTLKKLTKWSKKRKVPTPIALQPGKSFIYAEPYGIVLIISPWNYPFQLAIAPLIGAIAAGNSVVLKPSEIAPCTSQILVKLISQVFAENEVSVVEGSLVESQKLLSQKWDYIFFTGSTAIGRVVMKAAANHLTPVTLELGGKSPCIIEDSANLDLAAKRCAWGKFMNAGQTCVAPDYVLVPSQHKQKFIQKLIFYIKSFYGENPKNSLDFGRIINARHFERMCKFLDLGTIAYGGEKDEKERYISPTILDQIFWDHEIMEEEIFGPILLILEYDDLNEVIKQISIRPKPLALYFFSENKTLTNEVLKKLSFGGGCINDTVIHLANPYLPFGGVGDSGLGSYHGLRSFDTFSHYKSVFHQSTFWDIPLRYPPFKNKLKWLKFFIN